jgi:DNA-binding CsgD family transcriptional regulator/PAS domain-containing protein
MTAIDDFSRVVTAIYDAAVEPSNWTVALEEIASAVGSSISVIVATDRDLNEITVRSVGTDPANMIAYNEYYGRLDPGPSALERIPTGVVATQQQLVARDVWVRGEFSTDWARPNGYGDGIFSVLTRDGRRSSWLCAAATPKQGTFGTPERVALLGTLVPHLQQAIQTQTRLADLDNRHRDFVAAVDVLSDGIVIVGGDGRVVHLNPAAEAIVASADGLCVRSGYLRATVARTDGVLDLAVHRAFSRGRSTVATGGCVAVPRLSGLRPYVVRVIPLNPEGRVGEASSTVLVVIADPEREPQPESEALRRLYGLTKTEAAVAVRVLGGSGLKPIADDMSLSLATVRTHLQHVFDKTDTHRQAELVRLLLGGLAATRRPEFQEHDDGD